MPKKTPAPATTPDVTADATAPKKEETSKVIQLYITPYLNSILRNYIHYNEPMTNRNFFDLSIKCMIEKLEAAEINKKATVFTAYPKVKNAKTFSSYATKSLMDEFENHAEDCGIKYQNAYYSAVITYTNELINKNDQKMIKAVKESQEQFPDLIDQVI